MLIKAFIFEDNELIRTVITRIMKSRDYEVQNFSTPLKCPIITDHTGKCPHKTACVDIIITDVSMPGMSGLDMVEGQMRKGCLVKHIAVMSGGWTAQDLEKAQQLGVKIFEKPLNITELIHWLKECEARITAKKNGFDTESR